MGKSESPLSTCNFHFKHVLICRCQKNVAAAKKKRLDNIKRQRAESTEKLVAIKLKLAAGNFLHTSALLKPQKRYNFYFRLMHFSLAIFNTSQPSGNARRNSEIRNRQLRSLAACRWCAARRIQVW